MLSKADPQDIKLTATNHKSRIRESFITQRIWLPKVVYDSMPWFYLIAGLAALVATLYVSQWFWILPHYLLFSIGCLHICALVFRRRRASAAAAEEIPDQSEH